MAILLLLLELLSECWTRINIITVRMFCANVIRLFVLCFDFIIIIINDVEY